MESNTCSDMQTELLNFRQCNQKVELCISLSSGYGYGVTKYIKVNIQ